MSSKILSNVRSSLSRLGGVLLLATLLGSSVVTEAAAPAVGTVIRNQALATYELQDPVDPQKTKTVNILTNTVEAVITAVESITLVPDRQIQSSAGSTVYFSHTLSNNGNTDTRVGLQISNLSEDNFDLNGLKLIHDLNNNGIADPGEPMLAPGDLLDLAAGQNVSLILTGTVPGTVSLDDVSKLRILATATAGSTAQVNDTVTVNASVAPRLDKSASIATVVAGGDVTYTLNLSTGSNLQPRSVTVDGIPRQLIVVRDTIPANTVFSAVQQDAGALVMYQLYGGASNQYQTAAPAKDQLGKVSAIAFGFETLPAMTTVTVKFQVQVSIEAFGIIRNTGVIDAFVNGQPDTVPSNEVTVPVTDNPNKKGKLEYRDSDLTKPVYSSNANDPLNLYSVAAVCNTDPVVAEQYPVTLVSSLSKDSESGFLLTETAPNSGIFTIRNVPAALAPPSPVVINDNIMQVAYNDTVKATMVCGTTTLVSSIRINPDKGLSLQKTVSRDDVEIGETLTYTLKLRNDTNAALSNVTIDDTLPVGFTYVAGTARLEGQSLADPARSTDRKWVFAIGNIDSQKTVTLTYIVKVGVGATSGDGVNTAQAHDLTISSNIAKAKVGITKGVFGDGTMIFGKVFVDCNRDDLQGHEELGIPGVRVYLDDGTYAISDSEGKYSFYGVTPRTRTLKLDRTTLPPGAEMATVSNRNAGDPQSLFVDLKNGELHRADFAEGSCTPAIIAAVKERRVAGEVQNARIEADSGSLQDDELLQPLRTDAAPSFDPRARPAAGVVDSSGKIIADSSLVVVKSERNSVTPSSDAPLARTPSVNLEAVLPKLADNTFGFLDLKDGDTLPGTDVSVRVKGLDGATFHLFVDDVEIPANRIGQRARMPSRQLQVWEYIGIKLKPGLNKLRAENHDSFGNVRDSATISLRAPGSAGKLLMVLPPEGSVADGQTPARMIVRLLDADGVPVTARTIVTLESTLGRWDVEDLDPSQPGVQTFMQGGEALFDLIPPSSPDNADVRVSSGLLQAQDRLPFTAYLRPLIASGIIEGAVGFNKIKSDSIKPATAADGFEQDIKELNSDGTNAGIRGSMFLKGKIKGNALLTLAYDSDKDTNQRLFRDIDPENYYPIYGDASIKGFDAQSTSKLYVRIDKGRSYLLYGDFNTNTDLSDARKLSNYSRSLTGVHQHYETDKVAVNLFASHQTNQQQTTEFRAQGISGPYQLPGKGFLPNSEKIEIIVRDRNAPSRVITEKSRQLNRFVDYTIDELKGSIIFTSPIDGLDGDDLVFIRVTWEVENGGDAYWVYGADGSYQLTKFLEVGASVVRDNTPDASSTMVGANATIKISQDNKAVLEVARSQNDVGDAGTAWRAEWNKTGEGAEGRAYVTKSDSSFQNPNGALSSGSFEAGIKGGLKLSDSLRLRTEALYSESASTGGGRREGVFSALEYSVTSNLKTTLGARFTHQDAASVAATTTNTVATGDSNVTSVYSKIAWNPEALPKFDTYAEFEQGTSSAGQRMLGVGASYQIADRSRLYARHELISSVSGPFGLSELSQEQNTTAVGISYDYMENSNAFSEYRIRDAIDGPLASASVGLRNGWSLRPGLKLTTKFEREIPLSYSKGAQENTAVALGVQYSADPLLKAGARLEWRQGKTDRSALSTIALARKLSLDWSILAKNTLSWSDPGAANIDATAGLAYSGPVIRDRFRVGAAWRQTDNNEWAWLGLYENRYDRDPSQQQTRMAHILSSNVNYQPHRQWVLSGRYAMKFVRDREAGLRNDFVGNLISGRVMFDITEKWDAGLVASTIFDQGGMQYGVGAEAGYLITSNLWLSAGYNFFGYEDQDFDSSNSTRAGPYARLRFKFDEEIFRWLE